MFSVSVSHSKVLLFLDIGSMLYSVLQSLFIMDLRVTKIFSHEKYMFGCILASGWLMVWLCLCNALH
jgi:hypothetical protein